MARKAYLETLQEIVEVKYGCKAIHHDSVFVHETTAKGHTVWQGDVEIFNLIDYPRRKNLLRLGLYDPQRQSKTFNDVKRSFSEVAAKSDFHRNLPGCDAAAVQPENPLKIARSFMAGKRSKINAAVGMVLL